MTARLIATNSIQRHDVPKLDQVSSQNSVGLSASRCGCTSVAPWSLRSSFFWGEAVVPRFNTWLGTSTMMRWGGLFGFTVLVYTTGFSADFVLIHRVPTKYPPARAIPPNHCQSTFNLFCESTEGRHSPFRLSAKTMAWLRDFSVAELWKIMSGLGVGTNMERPVIRGLMTTPRRAS